MRILIDPEVFFSGPCGLVRYYSSVCKSLEKMGCSVDIPLVVSNSAMIDGGMQSVNKLRATIPAPIFRRLTDSVSKRWYYHKLRQGGYDSIILTSPTFEDRFLDYAGGTPFLMVVHDTMRNVPGPDGFHDAAGSNVDRLAYLARRAAMIICISEATRRDLIELCSPGNDKVVVIYSGNLLEGTPEKPVKLLPEKYLLFVGERSGRKNFRFLARALAPVLSRHKDISLVCTGKFSRWEKDMLDSLAIADRCIDIDAPDGVLLYLYQHALCLVYPTLYEGFGLPVLEAMTNGCPVITADSGSVREVAGAAARYVDPYDASSISSGALQIIEQPEFRRSLAELGFARAQLFSGEKMMESFLGALSHMKTS
jgi:glycosyltransferase involved in cell wall biosynthesis